MLSIITSGMVNSMQNDVKYNDVCLGVYGIVGEGSILIKNIRNC